MGMFEDVWKNIWFFLPWHTVGIMPDSISDTGGTILLVFCQTVSQILVVHLEFFFFLFMLFSPAFLPSCRSYGVKPGLSFDFSLSNFFVRGSLFENNGVSAVEFWPAFLCHTSRGSINDSRGEGIWELLGSERGNRPGIVSWQTGFRSWERSKVENMMGLECQKLKWCQEYNHVREQDP